MAFTKRDKIKFERYRQSPKNEKGANKFWSLHWLTYACAEYEIKSEELVKELAVCENASFKWNYLNEI